MIRIGLLGLGGVGGYFGAKLSRAVIQSNSLAVGSLAEDSHAGDGQVEVVFLARETTAAVIRDNGIKLITPEEEFVARPHLVVTPGEDSGKIDFLICTVKSYDLEESLQQFSACIGPQTIILPLQNGIDAADRTKKMFPENEVWDGCVYIVSRIVEPGVIRETGNIHTLHFGKQGADPGKLLALKEILGMAHDEVYLQPNIAEIVWEKFVFISVVASLTSYLDVCIGKILQHAGNRKLLMGLLREIVTVAEAEKILLREDIIPATIAKMERLPFETTSSMHSDFQRGAKTEIRSLTAHVVELAERHKIAVPVYRQVLTGLLMRQG